MAIVGFVLLIALGLLLCLSGVMSLLVENLFENYDYSFILLIAGTCALGAAFYNSPFSVTLK